MYPGWMAVTLRNARLDDTAGLTRLVQQLGYSPTAGHVAASLARNLARPGNRMVVAELDGRVAGCVHLVIADYVDVAPYILIGALVVDDRVRRQGIGRALMEAAEAWAAEQGIGAVRLNSSSTRAAAHRFYEAIGYTNIKTQYSFAKAIDGATDESLYEFVPRVD
jgi:GNAT superfamily N-acetyltransferase